MCIRDSPGTMPNVGVRKRRYVALNDSSAKQLPPLPLRKTYITYNENSTLYLQASSFDTPAFCLSANFFIIEFFLLNPDYFCENEKDIGSGCVVFTSGLLQQQKRSVSRTNGSSIAQRKVRGGFRMDEKKE